MEQDKKHEVALMRYSVISPLINLHPSPEQTGKR